MSQGEERKRFVQRYLDPGERLGEVLFGLIMVLTFTLTAGLTVGSEPGAGRSLLIATLGCNIAWGIIDGGMYIMSAMLERGRRAGALQAIQGARDDAAALQVIGRALDDTLAGLTAGDERRRLYRTVQDLALRATPTRTHLRTDDIMGAIACFLLVVLSTIPAALPFLFMENAWQALRVSNVLLVGMLFVIGYLWAGHANTNRWVTGLIFLIVGGVLVAVAIALGG